MEVIILFFSFFISCTHKEPTYIEEYCEDTSSISDTDFDLETLSYSENIGSISYYKMKLTFLGDIFWGRGIDRRAKKAKSPEKFPFEYLYEFQKQTKENWIANLECPITKETLPYESLVEKLKFYCDPRYLKEVEKYFDIFSLANNHTKNMEEYNGLEQTRTYLENHHIQFFGHYDNSTVDDICEIVDVLVEPIDTEGYPYVSIFEDDSLKVIPIALCGYHNVYRLPTQKELDTIAKYSKYFITIVMPHQGEEYQIEENKWQRSVFRSMIDRNADAVIGGHTHSIQGLELYNGKPIAYSLGNFIFDQTFSTDVRRGLIFSMNLTIPAEQDFIFAQSYLEHCREFKDSCWDLVSALNLPKLEYESSYDVQVRKMARLQTRKSTGTEEKQALKQARWFAFQKTVALWNEGNTTSEKK